MAKIVYMARSPDHVPLNFFEIFEGHDLGVYDPAAQYSATDSVMYFDLYSGCNDLVPQYLARGFRIIFDAKNEHYLPHDIGQALVPLFQQHPGQAMVVISGQTAQHIPDVRVVATPHWYWYIDRRSWHNQKLHSWHRNVSPKHNFFMQIGQARQDRDKFYQELINNNLLHGCLHSYRAHGIFLPNDVHQTVMPNWQRYVNREWYEDTWFSVSVESYLDDNDKGFSLTMNDNLFLCEKSYKAMACQHPFVLVSTYHNLSYLRSQGFETFAELFDETYDNQPQFENRINHICESIKNFDQAEYFSNAVQEKIQHNHARFFNSALIKQLFKQSFVDPVLEFVYAKV